MKLIASLLALVVFVPSLVVADELSNLQNQLFFLIQEVIRLQAELNNVQKVSNLPCYTLTRDLRLGDSGDEVAGLHKALEKEGFDVGSIEKNSKVFGENTASAVSGFQQKYKEDILTPIGISFGTGYFGKLTREKLNSLQGCGAKPLDLTDDNLPPAKPGAPPYCDSISTVGKNQLKGCMWSNSRDVLQGSPAGSAPDGLLLPNYIRSGNTALNYDWSTKVPNIYSGSEYYTARWRGKFSFDIGEYKFIAGADDGIKVWINGALQAVEWVGGPYKELSFPIEIKEAKEIEIQIDYRQDTGPAKVNFRWEKI